ncbi:NAD(P)/FAD-dependent oxidoreductase [Sporosarcina sp. ZBG7A]|uniref:FAD-dependent oxidoreductase n=1 Tax=Sporosarcina sp. ZBG7A TaxID=1582223 RepID=UPI00068D7CE4|nr:NAD(P)/FAD-dependent oxidoreductase [Sporosarcina sp. ZBG7A]
MNPINSKKGATNGSAIVVGASLSGLMTGIALAREGVQVTLLEKVGSGHRSGAGLQVDAARFNATGTERLLRNLASGGKRSIQLWSSIESRLRKEAEEDSRIELRYDTRVEFVDQDNTSAFVMTDAGETIHGDLLIGADGHHSLVRRHVAPDNPEATFAGYMVWIASTKEEELPPHMCPGYHHPEVTMLESLNGFLFGSIIESGGESGNRRIGCTWYDNSRNELLRHLGCVEGNVVKHSLKGPDIPQETIDELATLVSVRWDEPWKSGMLHALQHRNLTGTPIKEYVPTQLVHGRIALIGDAAHVPAPITASGFNASLQDAVDLGKCVSKGIEGTAAIKALKNYESLRLQKVRKMVQSGQTYNRSFGLGR